jgi:hypothetical protein
MVSKADNEKTLVILQKETYKTKIQDFTQNNQFTKLKTNPADQYQKVINKYLIKKAVHKCNKHIKK